MTPETLAMLTMLGEEPDVLSPALARRARNPSGDKKTEQ